MFGWDCNWSGWMPPVNNVTIIMVGGWHRGFPMSTSLLGDYLVDVLGWRDRWHVIRLPTSLNSLSISNQILSPSLVGSDLQHYLPYCTMEISFPHLNDIWFLRLVREVFFPSIHPILSQECDIQLCFLSKHSSLHISIPRLPCDTQSISFPIRRTFDFHILLWGFLPSFWLDSPIVNFCILLW